MINKDDQNSKIAQAMAVTFVAFIMLLLFFKILFF